MYSPHQMIPTLPGDPFQGSYNGKPFPESGLERWALTDQQKAFLEQDHIRHVLVMKLESAGHCRPVEQCHPAGRGGTALGHSGECVQ